MDGSNYSIYVEADVAIVWETMAKYKDGAGEALLRGDLKGTIMTGVMDIQPEKGKAQRKIYYFTSQKAKLTPAVTTSTTTTAGTSAVAATAKTTTTTTTTTTEKKKR